MKLGQDKFIWDIQWAGYQHDKIEKRGETNFSSFIEEFEKFPWIEQIEKANQFPEMVSPTLSVKDQMTGKDFWVSMSGDKNNHGYLIGYIYPKEKKGLFGLGKTKTIRWLEIYLTKDTSIVKKLFKAFFDRNYVEIEAEIKKLGKYGQMEAAGLAEK